MQTQPDRLATMATLFGMQPAPVEKCRVLELGCNDGSNLIPYAFHLPDSEFIGVDLSARSVAIGQKRIEALALKNVELRQFDVMNVDESFGQFDYIVAHGLFSWVPLEVREKILDICRKNLAPQGVAHVSYNAYPGCHLRDMTREMMLFHVKQVTDSEERIVQAIALIKFLSESFAETDLYRMFLKNELESLLERRHEQIFHDDLAHFNQPYYFYQFAEKAAAHGLQFLSEADYFEMQDHIYTPQVKETLRALSGNVIAKEQYLDFIKCRRFRQTLLCHQEVELKRALKPELMRLFYMASSARPVSDAPDASSQAVEEFHGPRGALMKTDHPLAKSTILCLSEIYPQSLNFEELLARARARAGEDKDHADQTKQMEQDALVLGDILLQVYAAGLIELHVHRPQFATVAGARPIASPLARWQIQHGPVVTTLLSTGLEVEDALGQRLLQMLDGTRDRAGLLAELTALIESGAIQVEGEPDDERRKILDNLPELLEQNLARLARLGLLVA
jgi:methyltransferase-like protein/2-polyprenyl-3-methyl-5-hydroxy-6-metoxy-1,4-benzoquinol methylase